MDGIRRQHRRADGTHRGRILPRVPRVLSALLAAMVLLTAAPATATRRDDSGRPVVAVSGFDPALQAAVETAAEIANPGLRIRWLRISGEEALQALAAATTEQGPDLVLGLPATLLLNPAQLSQLQPYRPRGKAKFRPNFRDSAEPPRWFGIAGYAVAWCIDGAGLAAAGLAAPRRWSDLVAPNFAGKIALPDPARSQVGMAMLNLLRQEFSRGRNAGLPETLRAYAGETLASGSAPCRMVADGQRLMGVSYLKRADATAAESGGRVQAIIPEGPVGWDADVAALLKAAGSRTEPRRLLDWFAGSEAHALFAEVYEIPATLGAAPAPAPWLGRLAPQALSKLASQRDAALAHWRDMGVRLVEDGAVPAAAPQTGDTR